MKFTLNWLKEHLETEASLDEILYALTDLGLEVEGVEDPAATLGAFTICRVIEAKQHPDADRLRLCRVEAWPNGPDKPWLRGQCAILCGKNCFYFHVNRTAKESTHLTCALTLQLGTSFIKRIVCNYLTPNV